MNSRLETINTIHTFRIPKAELANLVGIPPARVSDYCSSRHLPRATELLIEQGVKAVVKVWTTLGGGDGRLFRTDLADREGFRRALGLVEDEEWRAQVAERRAQSLLDAGTPIGSGAAV